MLLERIGLRAVTLGLGSILERDGVTALDLLVEIEKWELAKEEMQNMRRANSSLGGWKISLTCSRVYYETGPYQRIPTLLVECLLGSNWHDSRERYCRRGTAQRVSEHG